MTLAAGKGKMALYNDFRPHRFSDVVGQRTVTASLIAQAKADKFFSTYIFSGQYGGGKTSLARILSLAVNCTHKDENGNPCLSCPECQAILNGESPDVVEIAAAVDTGVGKVREICETAQFLPVQLKKKIFIIDEVHMLSKAAFNALLKLLEEPPEHTMFILCTTEVDAIPATVRSRSACYTFGQISQADIATHLLRVSKTAGIDITNDGAALIARYSNGSLRDSLSLLEKLAADGNTISGEMVETLLGISSPDKLFELISAIMTGRIPQVVSVAEQIIAAGADMKVMLNDLLSYVTDLSVACVAKESVTGSEHYCSLVAKYSMLGTVKQFCALASGLLDARTALGKRCEKGILLVWFMKIARQEDVSTPSNSIREVEELTIRCKRLEERLAALEQCGVPNPPRRQEEPVCEPEVGAEHQQEVCEAAEVVPVEKVSEPESFSPSPSSEPWLKLANEVLNADADVELYRMKMSLEERVELQAEECSKSSDENMTFAEPETFEEKEEEVATASEYVEPTVLCSIGESADVQAEADEPVAESISEPVAESAPARAFAGAFNVFSFMNAFAAPKQKHEEERAESISVKADTCADDSIAKAIETLMAVSHEYPELRAALANCYLKKSGTDICLTTPFPPVMRFISAHFSALSFREYPVELVPLERWEEGEYYGI